jgi:DeoR/GlpR family transcriptional regulator of sugar metabolism
MLSYERQNKIADYIRSNQSVTVKELRDAFDISSSTVRRDLEALESEHLIRRVHGGAVAVSDGEELPILERAAHQAAAKRRIGERAARFVDDGDTILITGGTTTVTLVPHLKGMSDLTVITNSVNCVSQLAHYPDITTVVLGGWLRHSELSLLGRFVDRMLEELRPNKVFHGIYSLSVKGGLMGSDFQEVRTDRGLIAAAPQVIVMADHTKFNRQGVVRLAPITVASVIVTDTEAPNSEVAALKALGIRVIQA